jgi:hypothetical protein
MQKPTQKAMESFDAAFPEDPRAVRKSMFGMPAGFVNGHMFLGVWADGVVLRLAPGTLEGRDGIGAFEPMEGRPWKEYVLADATRWGGTDDLRAWAAEALEATSTLPPKAPKKK